MRYACERFCAHARAYTPVVLFFCCHICHSRNILGGEELAYREANVLFFEVIKSYLTHIQQLQYVKSHRKTHNHLIFLLLQIICDRCDSKKHKTLVLNTRTHARERRFHSYFHIFSAAEKRWISSFVFSPWHNSSKLGSAHLA